MVNLASSFAARGKTVLIIDDEEPIRDGLALLLEEWGYRVRTIGRGSSADTGWDDPDGIRVTVDGADLLIIDTAPNADRASLAAARAR